MNSPIPWPKNVPVNIQHGQIWLVTWNTEARTPFFSREKHSALIITARVPETWPRDHTIPFLRSRTDHGNLQHLEQHEALENIVWLLNNPMQPGDWARDLARQGNSLLLYTQPYRLTQNEDSRRPELLPV